MTAQGKSSLLDVQGQLIGFGFGPHPHHTNGFLQVVIYRLPDKWVLCMSEGDGKGQPEKMRPFLGDIVPGWEFAKFAGRAIDGRMTYSDVRKHVMEGMSETVPGIAWEWLGADKLQYGRE